MAEVEYLSVTQFAALHGRDISRVRKLLLDGRITGAVKIGNQWAIPQDSPWPADARVTSGKFKNWRKQKEK